MLMCFVANLKASNSHKDNSAHRILILFKTLNISNYIWEYYYYQHF